MLRVNYQNAEPGDRLVRGSHAYTCVNSHTVAHTEDIKVMTNCYYYPRLNAINDLIYNII